MKKKNFMGLFALLSLFCMMSLACAGGTLNDPSSTSSMTGETFLVDYLLDGADTNGSVECDLKIHSVSLTNATTPVVFTNLSNTSVNQVIWNWTFNSNQFEDSNDYYVNITCTNGTEVYQHNTSSMVVDNTVPTAPTGLSSTTQTSGDFTLTSTVSGSKTTSCTMEWDGTSPMSGAVPTGTHSANTCTFSVTGANDGAFNWKCTASDETNSTVSLAESFVIDTRSGNRAVPGEAPGQLAVQAIGVKAKLSSGIKSIIAWVMGLFGF